MDNLEELKTSFKELTKYAAFLLIPLLTIGAYVIQRSYMAIQLSDSLQSDFIDMTNKNASQSQVAFSGLTFSYGAMNMFWPLIIFLLYTVVYYLIKKQSSILNIIRKSDSESEDLYFDSMNIYREIQNDKLGRIILKTLLIMPLIGMIAHFLAGIFIFLKLSSEMMADPTSADALILQLYLQLLLTFVSLLLSVSFPFKILKCFKEFSAPTAAGIK